MTGPSKRGMQRCPAPEVHALGEAVAAFGNLELFLEITLWQLLGEGGEANMAAKALTAEMSFRARVKAFGAGARIKHPALPKERLDSLVRDLLRAEQERNALAHSAWQYQGGVGTLVRIKGSGRQKGMHHRTHNVSTDKINGIRDAILSATIALADFTAEHLQGGEAQHRAG